MPDSLQRLRNSLPERKSTPNQIWFCKGHRILWNTYMKDEDELPLIEGLLALEVCSNIVRMYTLPSPF